MRGDRHTMSKKSKKRKKIGKMFYDFLSSVVKKDKKDRFEKTLPEIVEQYYNKKANGKELADIEDEDYVYDAVEEKGSVKVYPVADEAQTIVNQMAKSRSCFELLDDSELNRFIESTVCYDLGIDSKDDITSIQINDIHKNMNKGKLSITFIVKYTNAKKNRDSFPKSMDKRFLIDPEMISDIKNKKENNCYYKIRRFILILSESDELTYNKVTILSDDFPYYGKNMLRKYEYEKEIKYND